MIDPVIDALTRLISPACRAKIAMMSSARLPSEALTRPPSVGPVCAESSSVALPRRLESGTIASALAAKTTMGAACRNDAAMATGAATRSQSSQFTYRRLIWRRVVDEHDRDVVAHREAQAIDETDEHRLGLSIFEWTLALRADENFEQLRRETHDE